MQPIHFGTIHLVPLNERNTPSAVETYRMRLQVSLPKDVALDIVTITNSGGNQTEGYAFVVQDGRHAQRREHDLRKTEYREAGMGYVMTTIGASESGGIVKVENVEDPPPKAFNK